MIYIFAFRSNVAMSAMAVNGGEMTIGTTVFSRPSAADAVYAGSLVSGRVILVTVTAPDGSEYATHGMIKTVHREVDDIHVSLCPVHGYYEREATSVGFSKSQAVPWETTFVFGPDAPAAKFFIGIECSRRLAEIDRQTSTVKV